MEGAGFSVVVSAPDIAERSDAQDAPAMAVDLAQQKGRAAVDASPEAAARAAFTIAADTIVWTDEGLILGKPTDRADARRMLGALTGRTHQVSTGYALYAPGGELAVARAVTASVTMAPLSDAALEAYLDSDEPWDKAGAYGIQGLAGSFVSRLEGSWHTVVGLPIHDVLEQAHLHGLLVRMPWERAR